MVNFKRLWKQFVYQPSREDKEIKQIKASVSQAINSSEDKHACEIIFAIEDVLSLAWIFASVRRRAEYLFKQNKLNKLDSKKGILIYLQTLDQQLEVVVGEGVHVPKENWGRIISEGINAIDNLGMKDGCVQLVELMTQELVKYEPNSEKGENLIPNEVIFNTSSK